ncbi:MAG: M23 family metallopeptidase [Candidatus Marinimicrobia bacterium]|nr:M23 family metallopeptidase [Candidatus Neomarinimicrobiota bacterium]
MIRNTLLILVLFSFATAQQYHWPIKASQSLSATYCEYRDGHLHAGIDIKTWGEMEVPCYAVADGYIERIIVGYNGYGRGLFLRLDDGHLVIYGHLELFTPGMEALVQAEQQQAAKYSVRFRFEPDRYRVKAGQIIAYSGTSGTEHPHLHFEIRDSLNQVINPQLFYPGIKDTKKPVLDEIMLIPDGSDTRINNSRFPVIIDVDNAEEQIMTTGPFRLAINAHDRKDGTYNKYNFYRADAFVNDSLIYAYRFDRVPRDLTDSVTAVYPGPRGKRKWHFMSMFDSGMQPKFPFTPDHLNGIIQPERVSTLKLRVADIQRNVNSAEFVFTPQANASWKVAVVDDDFLITRSYTGNNYERYQFYTGSNTFIPVSLTSYRLHSTSWVIPKSSSVDGVRGLGSYGGSIKWLLPPAGQADPMMTSQWVQKDGEFVLRLASSQPYIYPLSYRLSGDSVLHTGEVFQINGSEAELEAVSLKTRAKSDKIELLIGDDPIFSAALKPFVSVEQSDSINFQLNEFGISLKVINQSEDELYLDLDTASGNFAKNQITGIQIHALAPSMPRFNGELLFQHAEKSGKYSVFSPGQKGTWKRLQGVDSEEATALFISNGGEFFLIRDDQAPEVKAEESYQTVRRGQRLVFTIREDTGVINYRNPSLSAKLDGKLFFPDYNPLRKEISFHIPKDISDGLHRFEIVVSDASENKQTFIQEFSVRP